ncbi:OmpA family protein [Pedobacter glucosidilyticus]|uniref:OmpA family protein n=1 Tax=Pedobacter glucosidilyticus TaxID=1122941 RepID=UPI0004162C93|nr:OmpA family protein [Pedobacter glucosidilyticus]
MKTSRLKISVLGLAFAIGATTILPGCDSLTNTQKGAGIGAAAGGTIGALIGNKAGNTAVGAIIGGALGGTAGAFIGRKMDRQAKELEQSIPGAEVIPAGEGIIVKFDSGLLFEFGKSTLSAAAKQNIDNLAASLNKYPDTDIMIIGHTDAIGSDAVNDKLSLERANAVRSYAVSKGVSTGRLKSSGKGKNEPIASNDTEEGRSQNRRVEIVIVANEAMKAEAKASSNN